MLEHRGGVESVAVVRCAAYKTRSGAYEAVSKDYADLRGTSSTSLPEAQRDLVNQVDTRVQIAADERSASFGFRRMSRHQLTLLDLRMNVSSLLTGLGVRTIEHAVWTHPLPPEATEKIEDQYFYQQALGEQQDSSSTTSWEDVKRRFGLSSKKNPYECKVRPLVTQPAH